MVRLALSQSLMRNSPGSPRISGTMISVILPTYNESLNLPIIIPKIESVLREAGHTVEIVVVDDNSPDNTSGVAAKLAETLPVRVETRTKDRGLASAVIRGFEIARGEVCVVMDADMSHPVDRLPQMVEPILAGKCDITVGSRYVPGGDSDNWPLARRMMSRGAGLLARGLTRMSDPTSGFMGVRKSLLNLGNLDPVGWKIVLEVVARTNGTVQEVPIIFQNRVHGESKLDASVQLDYLRHLWKLYNYRLPSISQFIKFCLVGASGVIVDTGTLMFFVEVLGKAPLEAAIFGFVAAVTWNYLLNRGWTFARQGVYSIGDYFRFVVVCLIGFAIRIAAMKMMLDFFSAGKGDRWYIAASLVGIVISTAFNFFGSKYFVFGRKQKLT